MRDFNSAEATLDRIKKAYDGLPADNRCIFTTEKDAARLRDLKGIREIFDDNFYYLPIGMVFQNDDQNEFNNHIIQYVRNNKQNRIVS